MAMNKPATFICFDLNKTLIHENSWLNLNLAMGISQQEDDDLMQKYEAGLISYEDANKSLLAMYKEHGRASRENIMSALSAYTYRPGARELVAYLQSKGYGVLLITGAMDMLADWVGKELGIEYTAANNVFTFNSESQLEDILMFGDDAEAKLMHLQAFAKKLGFSLKECICIGDGDNDRLLFEATGKGITFTGSKITDVAWKVVNDLAEIQKIL